MQLGFFVIVTAEAVVGLLYFILFFFQKDTGIGEIASSYVFFCTSSSKHM